MIICIFVIRLTADAYAVNGNALLAYFSLSPILLISCIYATPRVTFDNGDDIQGAA